MSDDLDKFLKVWSEPATRVAAGKQTFASPRLFISDPLDVAKTALTTETPTGAFEVSVVQKQFKYHQAQPSYLANAFLVVTFSEATTVRWEQVESEAPASVFKTEFSAEYGWMAIMDADTRDKVLAMAASVDNAWDDWLAAYFPEPIRAFHFAHVRLAGGGGLVVCGPGKGNGVYPAFLGRDEAGQATELVVDFCVRSIAA